MATLVKLNAKYGPVVINIDQIISIREYIPNQTTILLSGIRSDYSHGEGGGYASGHMTPKIIVSETVIIDKALDDVCGMIGQVYAINEIKDKDV